MKHSISYISALLLTALTAGAQDYCGMPVEQASLQRADSMMNVKIDMTTANFKLSGNRAVVFTPAIVNGTDSLALRPLGFYSRDRWYQYLRSGNGPVSGENELPMRYSERPDQMLYAETVPYEEWMNGSELVLLRQNYGCCHHLISEELARMAGYREVHYQPVFCYAQPVAAAAKTRELSGRAYIDFPVNRTEIYPEYRKNPTELAKIIATIDSVRNDPDVVVTAITIKGYASPESPWDNNTRLAKGRTATLKNYVQNLYHFDEGFILTDYEPEDWAGLREFVAGSNMTHKDQILALIDDTTIEPDPKELKLKTLYPDEYRFLLATVYPGLRHSDYTIQYMIRDFTDVNEIAHLLRVDPQKLNLNEIMLYAQTLQPGSDEYNEVFETAVVLFPSDPVANLNAANAAMQRNDMAKAQRYLEKAGDSPQADYARGVYEALQGNYDKATEYIEKAAAGGMADTQEILDHIKDVANQ